MDRRLVVEKALADSIGRLDVLLGPWGFTFEADGCQSSHTGPYASGHYVRGNTRIGLSCREHIDNIYYEHSFITEHSSWRVTECFRISHAGLMKGVGREDDCQLIGVDSIPDAITAREGGDRVAALIHDLSFAASILRKPSEAFYAIMRHGLRFYSVG